MSTNHTIKGRVFDFDCCPYVEFWGYCMLGMCDIRDVGCGMFAGMWDVDLQNAIPPRFLLIM